MARIVTFDYCAVITLFFLIFSLIFRKVTAGRSNKLFFIMVLFVLISGIFDILRFTEPNYLQHTEEGKIIVRITHYIYLTTRNLSTPLYALYIISICGLWYDFKKRRALFFSWITILFAIVLAITVDCFRHKMFIINDDLSFTRTGGMYFLYAFAFISLIYSITISLLYRKRLSRSKFITVMSLYPIAIIGIFIQMIHPELLVEVFFTTFPMLIISLVLQRPEELVDISTGTLNFQAFSEEVKLNFMARHPVNIILIKISNFELLIRKLKDDIIQNYVRTLLQKLNAIVSEQGTELYYLQNGLIAILSINETSKLREKTIFEVSKFLNTYTYDDSVDSLVETKLCYVRCPDDLPDYNSVINYIQNIEKSFSEDNRLIFLEKEARNKNFQIRNKLDSIIAKGIKNHSFEMYYQPIYNLKEKKFTTAEALIRLKDDEYGMISPGLFIPAAENNGAIHQIGEFVFDDVCRFVSDNKLHDLGLQYIEINLSVAQCIETNFYSKVNTALQKYKVNPAFINLEITETAMNVNHESSDINIKRLSEMSINFSLDDYGSGYSNIKRIMSLPLSIIKLDKSFADEFQNNDMKVVIASTISMFKKINKEILIEGVESLEAKNYFESVGCDYIQGYFYSKPLPQEQFIEFLKIHNEEVESL